MIVDPLFLLMFLNIPRHYENRNNQVPAMSSKLTTV